MGTDRELVTSRLITRKELSILSIVVGGALLLCWAIRAHYTNLAFAAPMPGQHLAEVKTFQVDSEDFFNVKFELPIPPSAHPKPAGLLACDFTLRVLADSGRVIDSRSVTSLASETFSYPASKLQIFYAGEPIFLSAGVYRVEIDNRADTPAFQARGAKLRLEPQTTGESAVTPLLLLSGVVLVALGAVAGPLKTG
jgi:hypothetical protein